MEDKPRKFSKDWEALAKGFLKAGSLGFLYLKGEKNIGRTKIAPPSKPIYRLVNGNLIVASIWNIKHGIELIIKALGITIDGNYWIDHNINDLMIELEKKLGPLSTKEHRNILKKMVKKYYECDFNSKTKFLDKDNTYFKYPETKSGNSLDYSFIHDLTRRDINQFIQDVKIIENIYDCLRGQPGDFESGRKIGLSDKEIETRIKKRSRHLK